MTNSIPPDSSQPSVPLTSFSATSANFASTLSAIAPLNQGSSAFQGPQWNNFNNSANQVINTQIQQAKTSTPATATPPAGQMQSPATTSAPQNAPQAPTGASQEAATEAAASKSPTATNKPGDLNLSGPGWDAFDDTAKKMFVMQIEQNISTQVQKDQAKAHEAAEKMKKVYEGDDS